MKYVCPLLVVEDINKAREFYCKTFGLKVISDFGANITFDAMFSLQTKASYGDWIAKEIKFCGNDAELYFEEDDLDGFIAKLEKSDIEYVHKAHEYAWGQRVVRIYDLDKHIIEVGENMEIVCKRFLKQGMTVEEVSKRTMYPLEYIKGLAK